MLPTDPHILFVDADGVLDDIDVSPFTDHRRVEIADLPEAVAVLGQGVGHLSQPPLAGIECVLPSVHDTGMPVGDDHLGDRGAVQDGPDPAAVLVPNGMEDESLVWFETDAHRPPLPAQPVALEGEAGAVRLGDLDRSEVVAPRSRVGRVVAAAGDGNGGPAVIDDVEDLAAAEVHESDHSFDRSRVLVVPGIVPEIRDRPTEASTALFGQTEAPGRPGVHLDLGEVVDPPASHRLLPPGVGPDGLGREPALLDQHCRTHPVHLGDGQDLTTGQRDEHLGAGQVGPGDEAEADAPVDRRASGGVRGQRGLGRRLVEDVGEAGRLHYPGVGPDEGDGAPELLSRQGFEGVRER